MRVLVVGGAGYLGGAVTDALLRTEHEFRVFDALLYEECYRKPVDFVYGDVRDWDALKPHVMWADAIIWLAALVGDGACQLNPEISTEINEEPLLWLTKNYDRRLIFTSTCSVYGAQKGMVLNEDSVTAPLSVYAATKIAAERHLTTCNALIFRLGTLFGIGDQFSRLRLDLVVNALTVFAHRYGKIRIYGGEQFRPLLHVRDAAQAIVDNLGTGHTGIFNLLRQNVRIIDLAYQIRTHFPDIVVDHNELAYQDLRDYRVSNQKAQSILHFRPTHSIDDAIEEMRLLLEDHRFLHLDSPRYTNHLFLSTFHTHKQVARRVGEASTMPSSGGNGEARAALPTGVQAAA